MKAVDVISKILDQCEDEDYIFRGTNEQFSEKKEGDGINSFLYRWAIGEKVKFGDKFHPQDIEKEIVEKAKKHFPAQTSNIEILTELQHYGGKTNCIDFSRNLYIALFFSCNGDSEKDGELILLDKNKYSIINEIKYDQKPKTIELIEPAITHSSKQRVHFQSSAFVRAPDGYLKKDDLKIISIRKNQKQTILTYLEKIHNINQDTIYNDIFGFIENEKNYQTAAFYKGLANGEEGKYEEAIKDFTQAIKLKPNMTEAYINRGNAYQYINKYDEAIKDFTQAIKLKPNMAEAYYNRGAAYGRMKKYDEAIKDFTQAIKLKPNMAESYYNLGISYFALGEYHKAIENYTQAIKLDPNMAYVYCNRGATYQRMDKHDEAIKDFTQAINLEPNNPIFYQNRSISYFALGNKKLAEEDKKKALELKSKSSN